MEILIPMRSTEFLSLTMVCLGRPTLVNAHGKPLKLDNCYVYDVNRETIMHQWPAFFKPGHPLNERLCVKR